MNRPVLAGKEKRGSFVKSIYNGSIEASLKVAGGESTETKLFTFRRRVGNEVTSRIVPGRLRPRRSCGIVSELLAEPTLGVVSRSLVRSRPNIEGELMHRSSIGEWLHESTPNPALERTREKRPWLCNDLRCARAAQRER